MHTHLINIIIVHIELIDQNGTQSSLTNITHLTRHAEWVLEGLTSWLFSNIQNGLHQEIKLAVAACILPREMEQSMQTIPELSLPQKISLTTCTFVQSSLDIFVKIHYIKFTSFIILSILLILSLTMGCPLELSFPVVSNPGSDVSSFLWING